MESVKDARARVQTTLIDTSVPVTATITTTFSPCAENHVRNQVISSRFQPTSGLALSDFERARAWFTERGYGAVIYHLNALLPAELEAEEACLLVVPGGVEAIVSANELFQEQLQLPWDTQVLMYGEVRNKQARYNRCSGEESQEPNYAVGEGTVVAFSEQPLLNRVRDTLPQIFGEKARELVCEGNYYYNVAKCGIGWHGDAERNLVVGVRLGATMPLRYRWYQNSQAVGEIGHLDLEHGTIYAMSEKAVGQDWKKRLILTLRHAAGAPKYIQ
jgi:hypothetical protein